jgi:hypothetical protein
MTQEDKELLLKDLCARLPYEIILVSPNERTTYQTDGNTAAELLVEEGWKPYLRPMSSMTEEEKKEYHGACDGYLDIYFDSVDSLDWLNEHHFDYRGLIPKGLAIKVTKDNNPYKV